MRTKKILSILLAVILAAGVFGMTGVVAADEVVTQAAIKGWNGNVTIYEDYTATTMTEGLIAWDSFLATDDGTQKSFYDLYKIGQAKATWTVERSIKGDFTDTAPVIVKKSWSEASVTSGVYADVTTSRCVLYIKQPTTPIYGTIRATLKVEVTGGTPIESISAPCTVTFKDPTGITDLVKEAEEELAKTDRYTKLYLDNLKAVTNAAKATLQTIPSQDAIDSTIAALKNAIAGVKVDPADETKTVSIGDIYKLTGWEWLDSKFGQSFLSKLWGIIDFFTDMFSFFTKAADAMGPIIDFFGKIGSALGFVLPLFTTLFGLFGL